LGEDSDGIILLWTYGYWQHGWFGTELGGYGHEARGLKQNALDSQQFFYSNTTAAVLNEQLAQ
jgi:hypothetical protein